MAKLQISLEVLNPDEVIVKEKGKLIGFAAKLLSKEKRKEKVENEILLALKNDLGESLSNQLRERGIDSVVDIELIE